MPHVSCLGDRINSLVHTGVEGLTIKLLLVVRASWHMEAVRYWNSSVGAISRKVYLWLELQGIWFRCLSAVSPCLVWNCSLRSTHSVSWRFELLVENIAEVILELTDTPVSTLQVSTTRRHQWVLSIWESRYWPLAMTIRSSANLTNLQPCISSTSSSNTRFRKSGDKANCSLIVSYWCVIEGFFNF